MICKKIELWIIHNIQVVDQLSKIDGRNKQKQEKGIHVYWKRIRKNILIYVDF